MPRPPSPAVWYSRSSVPTPLGLAAQLGWLEEARAPGTVRSLQASSDPALRHAHVDHRLPNALRQGGSVPAIWARAAGADTRLVGLTWTDEFQVLLARRGSGIRRPRDLAGRRLGLPRRAGEPVDMARATALRGYLTLLEQAGIGYGEVELVDVPAPPRAVLPSAPTPAFTGAPAGHLTHRDYAADVAALLAGQVDVIYVKGVRGVEVARLSEAQLEVALDIGGHPDLRVRSNNATPRPLTVSAALLREQPRLVSALLARVAAVGTWAERNPAATIDLLSRETGSPAQWVRFAYGVEVHRHLHIGLADYALTALEDFKNFLFQWGFLPENFSLQGWLDETPLAAGARRRG